MESLQKTYEAIDMLKSLGLPVSNEQLIAVSKMEREYLQGGVIPLIKAEMEPLVETMRNKFQLEVIYSREDGLDIQLVERRTVQDVTMPNSGQGKRQKKFIIRVTFPDNHVSCNKMVWKTLLDVVRYAGPEKVRNLNMYIMGGNLVSPDLHENERYRVGQKEVSPGLYVCTYSSTETKYAQIMQINRSLNLGLKIEKVLL